MWKYGFLTLFLLFCLCLSATEKKDFEKAEREQCPSYYSCRLAKEWQRIESIIRSMELSLPDYDADCKEIEDRLDRENMWGITARFSKNLIRRIIV